MNAPIEVRCLDSELRYHAESRTVTGTVMRYGDVANIAGEFRERFQPGALRGGDVILNLMHDRNRPLARGELRAIGTVAGGKEAQEDVDKAKSDYMYKLKDVNRPGDPIGGEPFSITDTPKTSFKPGTVKIYKSDNPAVQPSTVQSKFGQLNNPDFDPNAGADKTVSAFGLGESVNPGGMSLKDKGDRMELTARLIDTADGETAARMLQGRLLRGLSIEFRAIDEVWSDGGELRTINAAILTGVALVDRPAYPESSINYRRAILQGGFTLGPMYYL